jgi:hypothetical protein
MMTNLVQDRSRDLRSHGHHIEVFVRSKAALTIHERHSTSL